MTINENWDSLDQSTYSTINNNNTLEMDEDSVNEDDIEDEEEEGDVSDSDLSDSSASIHSQSSIKSTSSQSRQIVKCDENEKLNPSSILNSKSNLGLRVDSCDSRSNSDSQVEKYL